MISAVFYALFQLVFLITIVAVGCTSSKKKTKLTAQNPNTIDQQKAVEITKITKSTNSSDSQNKKKMAKLNAKQNDDRSLDLQTRQQQKEVVKSTITKDGKTNNGYVDAKVVGSPEMIHVSEVDGKFVHTKQGKVIDLDHSK
ncbi:hypothetical protein M3Y95_00682200 [Aphelenchoides besseyi]|nr:hypothetical protein M3Y95_00682200 [Aphelenchoides besseyi]